MSAPAYTGITRWLVTLTVILVAVVEVLDMTIVNVSLPNMMGTLGADTEQITWILTFYVVSAAIFMPLTGFLVNRVGQKKLLLINIVGFLLTSTLCGLSNSLIEIVFFRILQGVFGASLVPLSQIVLRDAFPIQEQGKAMAIWGVGIMVAPVLGPTLGGYITEVLSWRWVFYINIPVCLFAFFMAWRLIIENPTRQDKVDWIGLCLMAIGIGCLQIFLDRGNQDGWFSSHEIILYFIIWTTSLGLFLWRGLRINDNIVNLRLFQDYNFSSGCLLITLYSLGIFGVIALQPILLEGYMHYNTITAGLIMAPRGITSAIAMMLVASWIRKYDPRYILAAGIFFSATGTLFMAQHTLNASIFFMVWTTSIQGFGMGLFFVPLSVLAFSTLPKEAIAEGAGIFSFGRNLGISIGISILSTTLTRENQTNWNRLGSHIQPFNPNLTYWLNHQHWQLHDPLALQTLMDQLQGQAAVIAFNDVFWMVALIFFALLPFIFVLKKPAYLINFSEAAH